MADQFFTDFSQYTTGQFPSDWTLQWDPDEGTEITVEEVAGATGGKVLRFTNGTGSSNRHAVLWDVVDAMVEGRMEAEVLIRARVNDFSSASSSHIAALARLGGSVNSRAGYSARPRNNTNLVDSFEFLEGSSNGSSIGASADANWTDDTWFFLGLKLNSADNATVQVRQWIDGSTERNWATQDNNDFEVPDGGVGVSAIGHDIVEIDWIGVGVNGEEAPREAIVGETFSIISPAHQSTGVSIQPTFVIANPDNFEHHNLRIYEDDNGSPGSKIVDVIFEGDQHTLTTPLDKSDVYFTTRRRL